MLTKQITVGYLITFSTCMVACAQSADVAYCEPRLGIRAEIDFTAAQVIYHDGLLSDQAAQIVPCSDDPRKCFVGEISYFDPFVIEAQEFPLSARVTIAADGASRGVEIDTEEFQFRYQQTDRDNMPAKLEVFRKSDSAQFNYELCNS